jgi:lipoprotein-anchoring transpeptidase ErfK/SrfK
MKPGRRMRRTIRDVTLALSAALSVACGENRHPGVAAPAAASDSGHADAPTAPLAHGDAGVATADGGPLLGALFFQTPIMSDMEWLPKEDARDRGKRGEKDSVARIGYIRHGGKVPVIPEAHPKSNCLDGWYELVAGGFVCGKYATLDLNHPRVKTGPHPPDLEGPLPYEYGYNLTNGTPMYRHVPSRQERSKLEPWLAKRAKPKRVEDDSTVNPFLTQDADLDAGIVQTSAPGMSGVSPDRNADPVAAGQDPGDSGIPWYLRDWEGGKPQVVLDDLKGDEGSPIEKRMVRGFYLALDKDETHQGTKWWKTTAGLLVPFDRIFVNKTISDFHGIWMRESPADNADPPADAGTAPPKKKRDKSAVGFILWVHAHKFTLSEDKKKATQGDPVPRFTIVRLTGESAFVGGYVFQETEEGWWMRMNEATKTAPGPTPKDLAPNEKWIDVNLTTQTMMAFEGDKPVYATLVSTGKRDLNDKEKDHPTPKGTFRIREKHIAATMDGDVASDGPYSIEDVPWIMYFNMSYALHGAFWHSNFGHTQSHGCVNLSPLDAKAMFGWTEPALPEGWHAVMSTEQKPGTRVIVHD